jgi:hypothetical protein
MSNMPDIMYCLGYIWQTRRFGNLILDRISSSEVRGGEMMLLGRAPLEIFSLHHCNTAWVCVIMDDKSEKIPKGKFVVHFNTSKHEINLNHI